MRNKKVKRLEDVYTGIDLLAELHEARELKASLALELDFARHCRQAQEREFREFINELWATLRKIQAQMRIDATLLGLIEPEKARVKGPPNEAEKDLNQELTDWH